MQEPEEIVRPEAVQAEQEVVNRAVEDSPVVTPPSIDVNPSNPQQPSTVGTTDRPSNATPEVAGMLAPASRPPEIDLSSRSVQQADTVNPVVPDPKGISDVAVTEASYEGVRQPLPTERLNSQLPAAEPVERVVSQPNSPQPTYIPPALPPNADFKDSSRGGMKPPNWMFPEKKTPAGSQPVSTEKTAVPHTEIADPLRFAAAAVTAVERQRRENGTFNPQLNASVASKQVTPNIRVETIIPEGFPVDARDIFSRIDKEIQLPNEANGDPFLAKQVDLPAPYVGDSTEQAIARHYASVQGLLDLDQRNNLE